MLLLTACSPVMRRSCFVLSFSLTWVYFWLIWTPLHLPDSLIALGGFGPAASAFLVLALTSGRRGVLCLHRYGISARIAMLMANSLDTLAKFVRNSTV